MSVTTHTYYSYNQFNNGCRSRCIFTARDKILTRNENQGEKKQQQQKQRKKQQHQQQQQKTSQKSSIIHSNWNWYKYSNKTDQIDGSNWETHFCQNGSIRFGLLKFDIHGNAEFDQEMTSLEKSIDPYRKFTHGLNKQKLRYFVRTICLAEYITFSASLRYT